MHARVSEAAVGRLATVAADGRPHIVPCCFAVSGESIFSAFISKAPMDPAIGVDGARAFKSDDVLIRRRFYNTSSDEDAAWAVEQLCAEPIAPMTHPVHVTPDRFGRVPRAFIQTRFDNAVPFDAQAAMCATLPCDPVIVMDTDHSPFFSAPQEFAAHIHALAG